MFFPETIIRVITPLIKMQAMCGFYSTPDGADYGEANLEEMNELIKEIEQPVEYY